MSKIILCYCYPLLLVVLLIGSCSEFEEVAGDGFLPVADFTVNKKSCIAPCEITFTNTSQNAIAYLWDLGDGTTSTVSAPTHTYENAGIYNVQLMAISALNDTTKAVQVVEVQDVEVVNTSDSWMQKSDFPGEQRYFSIYFSVGGYGYIGLGRNLGNEKLSDIWKYDPTTNSWSQKADFEGGARDAAVTFVINDKVYLCTGANNFGTQSDVWEYDYLTDTWVEKENQFPGVKREGAFSFVINGKAYVGGGTLGEDFWEYDPAFDTWTQKADVAEKKYCTSTSFVLDGKGYVATGYDLSNGEFINDVEMYDPITDTWQSKRNFMGTIRASATAFVINNQVFLGTGFYRDEANTEVSLNDFWTYDSQLDTWTQLADFEGGARDEAASFVIDNKAYIGGGVNFLLEGELNDFWEYTP